tara:strand:- start:206 stop:1627 length:1422 start_codon:yes stop_codon:yes gene_type:complete
VSEDLFREALSLFQEESYDDCVKILSTIIDLGSEDERAVSYLIDSFLRLGDIQKAINAIRLGMNFTSCSTEFYFKSAKVLKRHGLYTEALQCFEKASNFQPNSPECVEGKASTLYALGQIEKAAFEYEKLFRLRPNDLNLLNNIGVLYSKIGDNLKAKEYFDRCLERDRGNGTARYNLSCLLNKEVPQWHVGMLKDLARNDAYNKALNTVVKKGDLVLEIGSGSGLLSMMASDSGAKYVYSCEKSSIIAKSAEKIIKKNGYNDKITIINKNSKDLLIGEDLPDKADVIVSEILSSEFAGEGVFKAINDASSRLLKPNGRMIPESGELMICLFEKSGDLLDELLIDGYCKYDLSDFNDVISSRRYLQQRADMSFLSNPFSANRFDFVRGMLRSTGTRLLNIDIQRSGECMGIAQWMRLNLAEGVSFENSPGSDSHWRIICYLFPRSICVRAGDILPVQMTVLKDAIWFQAIFGV